MTQALRVTIPPGRGESIFLLVGDRWLWGLVAWLALVVIVADILGYFAGKAAPVDALIIGSIDEDTPKNKPRK